MKNSMRFKEPSTKTWCTSAISITTLTLLLGLSNIWSMNENAPILAPSEKIDSQNTHTIEKSSPQKEGGVIHSYEKGNVFVTEHTNARNRKIWMVMEKLDRSHVDFWKKFGENQVSLSGFDGFGALRDAAPYFVESIQKSPPSDLWVCYVSHAPVETYAQNNLDANQKNKTPKIEGVVTISTDNDLPVYTPMGIFRTGNYVLIENEAKEEKNLEEKKELLDMITPSLSLLMHSYAAKIVNVVAAEKKQTKKDYMITTPAPVMQQIIWAKTPHDKVWIQTKEVLKHRETNEIVTEDDFVDRVRKNFNNDLKNEATYFDDLDEKKKKKLLVDHLLKRSMNFNFKRSTEKPFFVIRKSKKYENLNQYYPIGWDPRDKTSPLSIKRNESDTGVIWTITLPSGEEKEFRPTETMRAASSQMCPWMTVDADTLANMYNWHLD